MHSTRAASFAVIVAGEVTASLFYLVDGAGNVVGTFIADAAYNDPRFGVIHQSLLVFDHLSTAESDSSLDWTQRADGTGQLVRLRGPSAIAGLGPTPPEIAMDVDMSAAATRTTYADTGDYGAGTSGRAIWQLQATSARGTAILRGIGSFATPGAATLSGEATTGHTSTVVADAIAGVTLGPSSVGRLGVGSGRSGFLPGLPLNGDATGLPFGIGVAAAAITGMNVTFADARAGDQHVAGVTVHVASNGGAAVDVRIALRLGGVDQRVALVHLPALVATYCVTVPTAGYNIAATAAQTWDVTASASAAGVATISAAGGSNTLSVSPLMIR